MGLANKRVGLRSINVGAEFACLVVRSDLIDRLQVSMFAAIPGSAIIFG